MRLEFEERFSDSPYVERIWRTQSEACGRFTSIASNHWMMVVTRLRGTITLDIQGPETKPTSAYCPAEGDWLGIIFKFGTFMPRFPINKIINGSVVLPEAGCQSFWLQGASWQFPTYENADTFVDHLVRQGPLVREPAVNGLLRDQVNDSALRSAHRHFQRATGFTFGQARQIERARCATSLLQQGVSVHDVIYELDYFDQSHLTRAMKRFVGFTPAQIMDRNQSGELSFLYNTALFY